MSSNRVAVISGNRFHDQITFQPKSILSTQNQKQKSKNGPPRKSKRRVRCMYCDSKFSPESNKRGSCKAAPDYSGFCIEAVTCVCFMRGLIYHFMYDSEDEFAGPLRPCSCDTSDEYNCAKWTLFPVCTLFCPCMLFYWPLRAVRKICLACGCCGGRHKAAKVVTMLGPN